MKTVLFIVYWLVVAFQSLYSQENFIEGYIVSTKNDTLYGKIDYREWLQNPERIDFLNSNSKITAYSPYDILGFNVSGESYKSATVKTEQSPVNTQELNFSPELILKTKTVFLLNLVDGEKQLFVYHDSLGKEHFYIPTDSGMTLLIYKVYLHSYTKSELFTLNIGRTEPITDIRMENKTYTGQLAKYLEDCQPVFSQLSAVRYTQNDITELFNQYKKSCHPELAIHRIKKITIEFGFVTGISLNSMKFGNNETYAFSKTSYSYFPNIVAGFSIDARLRGNSNKWSIYNEVLVAPYHIEGEYLSYRNNDWYTLHKTEISVPYTRMNNMLRFRYPLKKLFLSVNAGLSTGYGRIRHNSWQKDIKQYSIEKQELETAIRFTDSFDLGFNAGFGCRYRRWSIDARWEKGDGMSTLSALKSHTLRYYFLLGYIF
ncbi:MAG TPA: hypothetical protein VK179_16215 [Bacteroidales bacterium]|nr:hypothetical protein [Bacteroidales bacterium]